jgi:Zn-dependent protease
MPLTSWKLGTIAGTPILLHPSFLIVPFVISVGGYGFLGLLFALMLYLAMLLHEIGHALTARAYGIATSQIKIYPLGCHASLVRRARSAGPEILILLAGPLTNLTVLAIVWPVSRFLGPLMPEALAAGLKHFFWINVGVFAFNFLPFFPFDGAAILRALLATRIGKYRATEFLAILGRYVGVIGGLYFFVEGPWFGWVLAPLIYFAGGIEQLNIGREQDLRRKAEGFPDPDPGFHWVDRGDGVWTLKPLTANRFQGPTTSRNP